MPLKAVILAGGLGTRAKPFTDYSPKPLIPIENRPTIDYVLRYLSSFPVVDEIIIVCNMTDGRGSQIRNYFEGKENILRKKITFVEDKFEGTGGAILRCTSYLKKQKNFIVWFSDNLCPMDIDDLLDYHSSKNAFASVVVSSKKREETGFVETNEDGRIVRFEEKPVTTLTKPEALAIYVFNTRILRYITEAKRGKHKVNLSFDVLQKLPAVEKIYAYDIGELPWIDVESPVKIERNAGYVNEIVNRMEARTRGNGRKPSRA